MPDASTELADRLRLTVYGVAKASRADFGQVITQPFLVALAFATEQQRSFVPDPDRVVEISLSAKELAGHVRERFRGQVDETTLGYLLAGEPATWTGVNFSWSQPSAEWTWDLHRRSLANYADVRTVEDYLDQLETLVGVAGPEMTLEVAPVSPMTLPMMIDYVDTVWRLHAHEHLFNTRGLTFGAKLSQPCVTLEDFESRISALADVLNTATVPAPKEPAEGSLQRLKRYLSETLEQEHSERTAEAIDSLRAIIDVRVGRQHAGASQRGVKGMQQLGLPYLVSSWTEAWDVVAGRAATALETIREAIERLAP